MGSLCECFCPLICIAVLLIIRFVIKKETIKEETLFKESYFAYDLSVNEAGVLKEDMEFMGLT